MVLAQGLSCIFIQMVAGWAFLSLQVICEPFHVVFSVTAKMTGSGYQEELSGKKAESSIFFSDSALESPCCILLVTSKLLTSSSRFKGKEH